MSMNTLFLEKAIARLEEGLARYQQDVRDTQICDGLIQRFEFTYELSCKTLKRYLESVSQTPAQYDSMTFADLIRCANEQGLLLSDSPKWHYYRDMHTKASHTYDEDIALAVVADIPRFLEEACFLRNKLQELLA